jgi:hypothetical protein
LRGMGAAADRKAEHAELSPESDAALVAEGWATLTPLVGVREDLSSNGVDCLNDALATFIAP